MNNQQIKEKLQQLAEDVPDFTVVLSGKKSKKVDGLYKPDLKEIIIHNKNMRNDDDTMYTAIHEFAHHVHCCGSGVPASGRYHTRSFWAILHNLLKKAEEKKIYNNVFKEDEEFIELTKTIRENYIIKNGMLMKELGGLLAKARKFCFERHLSFDDYSDRELGIHRTIAAALISIHDLDISPEIGFENMKTVVSIKVPEKRAQAEKSFIENESPDIVKDFIIDKKDHNEKPEDPVKKLIAEKNKIIKTIDTLEKKLVDINTKLSSLENISAVQEV
ncbi:MAG: hypothetical protein FWF38_08775 [Spirochaetaceae bacterium]|nr:hypothetical protein [Spirochaetaceae bacterium]